MDIGSEGDKVRLPTCADDRWYPSAGGKLREEVAGYIEDADVLKREGEVLGLVSPHAGYFFSGHVAGAAFAQVKDEKYDTVVLLGPDHRGSAFGRLAFLDVGAWRTPIGDVPVDRELIELIGRDTSLHRINRDAEHSLEVQVPFMQVALEGGFMLAPVMMGDTSQRACESLGKAIASATGDSGKKVLMVASTDLSHYHSYDEATRLDEATLAPILDMNPDRLCSKLDGGRASACGGGPVAAVMYAAGELGADEAVLVKYANSGDVYHDRNQVVGYAAVMILGKTKSGG